jgi:hypothetical protein
MQQVSIRTGITIVPPRRRQFSPTTPLAGDTHGYTHIWYVPGNHFPVFLSENSRVSTPAMRTMKVMMEPTDLWRWGTHGQQEKNSDLVWPATWNKYNSNFGYLKLGHSSKSSMTAPDLDAMLYRIGWGHGQYIRSRGRTLSQGNPRPSGRPLRRRLTKGHILWKLKQLQPHLFRVLWTIYVNPTSPITA